MGPSTRLHLSSQGKWPGQELQPLQGHFESHRWWLQKVSEGRLEAAQEISNHAIWTQKLKARVANDKPRRCSRPLGMIAQRPEPVWDNLIWSVGTKKKSEWSRSRAIGAVSPSGNQSRNIKTCQATVQKNFGFGRTEWKNQSLSTYESF